MKLTVLLLFLLVLLGPAPRAQVYHTTPHNGQVQKAGNFKVEVVDCSGYLEVYLYDRNMDPIRNSGLSGWVDFHYPDSACISAPLYSYGVDGFTTEPERLHYSSCEVFIRGRGMSLRAMFSDIVCVRPEEY